MCRESSYECMNMETNDKSWGIQYNSSFGILWQTSTIVEDTRRPGHKLDEIIKIEPHEIQFKNLVFKRFIHFKKVCPSLFFCLDSFRVYQIREIIANS